MSEHTVDLDVDLHGGVGRITVVLPTTIGVRVNVNEAFGKVNADDLTMEDGIYINSAYDQSEVTMRINIDAGVGAINLQLGE
ncbi:MAG: LiaF-related protein [Anaerolineae bacterium]|nr:LiaF-related protein [Anaerolineae bacterium]